MAFCNKCGAPLDGNAQFCNRCGASTSNSSFGSSFGSSSSFSSDPQMVGFNSGMPTVQHSMNWYKFLIYFALFFGAAINVIGGIVCMTGSHYDIVGGSGAHYWVYAVYGGLKALDIIYGLAMIALGAFGIYTRFRLSAYRTDGPMCLLITYGAAAGLSLLYSIIVSSIIGEFPTENIGSIVGSVVMIVLNYIYFDKRRSYFNR